MSALIGKTSGGWEYGRTQCHSMTGARFREICHPLLGDSSVAWEDPSGIVWIYGGVLERGGDSPRTLFTFCTERGLNVPTMDNYRKLAEYMGLKQGGFRREIMPGLEFMAHTSEGPCFTGITAALFTVDDKPVHNPIGAARGIIHVSQMHEVINKLRAMNEAVERKAREEREKKEKEESDRRAAAAREATRRANLSLEDQLREALYGDYRNLNTAKALATNMQVNINSQNFIYQVPLVESEGWLEVLEILLRRRDINLRGKNDIQAVTRQFTHWKLGNIRHIPSQKLDLLCRTVTLLLSIDGVDPGPMFQELYVFRQASPDEWKFRGYYPTESKHKDRVILTFIENPRFNPNVSCSRTEMLTPLMNAAASGNIDILRALLRRPETDLMARNKDGLTARQLAKKEFEDSRTSRYTSSTYVKALEQAIELIKADPRWKKDDTKSWW